MPTMTLPTPLFALIPESERQSALPSRCLRLESNSWPGIAEEMRLRFPGLADRVLTDSGAVSGGFALVINDEVMPRNCSVADLADGDALCLIAAIAGG